ncbi:MAG: methyltransferase type 12 [uncultured bacterium]|nr:MAG: methyltransferase type 12 [uncultured bacterium]
MKKFRQRFSADGTQLDMVKKFFVVNFKICSLLERFFPIGMKTHGYSGFVRNFVHPLIGPGKVVFDVGSGRSPILDRDLKHCSRISVIGLDISEHELNLAPPGSYDSKIVADIGSWSGQDLADLVICRMLFEHLPDVASALRNFHSLVKPGGRIAVLLPCRNSFQARISSFLPSSARRKILHSLFSPSINAGYPVYYQSCTISELTCQCQKAGFEVEGWEAFYWSDTFFLFWPAYLIWRMVGWIFYSISPGTMCENFAVMLRKPLP